MEEEFIFLYPKDDPYQYRKPFDCVDERTSRTYDLGDYEDLDSKTKLGSFGLRKYYLTKEIDFKNPDSEPYLNRIKEFSTAYKPENENYFNKNTYKLPRYEPDGKLKEVDFEAVRRFFERPSPIDFVTFQSAARTAQEQAGVDPDKCLKIVHIDTYERIDLRTYLEHLSRRQLAVSNWVDSLSTDHDAQFHIVPAAKLHPDLTDLVSQAATNALVLLDQGKRDDSVRLASLIDVLLAFDLRKDISIIEKLITKGIIPFSQSAYNYTYFGKAATLVETQTAHDQAISLHFKPERIMAA